MIRFDVDLLSELDQNLDGDSDSEMAVCFLLVLSLGVFYG